MKATAARTRIGFQNVLFLTDFSEPSGAALPFAMAIARAYNSKISVLHVLQPDPLLYSTPTSVALAQEAQEDAAKAGMQRVSAQLAGLPHDTLLEWGTGVWPSVEQALKSSATDLIVVGTRGRTGAERFLLGSVAEEIFRRSPVPVLTVGPFVRSVHGGSRFHSVLFSTDFSPHSRAALPYALSLAQENQARLTLLHILSSDGLHDSPSLNQTEMAAALSKLKDLIPEGTDNWCRPETLVEIGEPASRILEVASRQGADLIVLGVRSLAQLSGASTHLGRATAHKVVAHASCPVLTVRGS